MVDDKGPAFPNAFPELQKLMEEVRELRFMIAAIETSRTKTDEMGARGPIRRKVESARQTLRFQN